MPPKQIKGLSVGQQGRQEAQSSIYYLIERFYPDSGKFDSMTRLTFYYKEGCWLCDQAEEMLNGLIEKYDIAVNKVSIESDDELYELYRFDIPVFEFRDGSALAGRIKKKDLLKKIEENRE